jgi:hypothetical protein
LRDAKDRNRRQVSKSFWFSSALCFCSSACDAPLKLLPLLPPAAALPPAPAATAAPFVAANSAVLSAEDDEVEVEVEEVELLSFWSSDFSAAKWVWSLVT